MKSSIKKIILGAGAAAGLVAASGETIAFLLSHRKANLDFIFKDDEKELSEFESALRDHRKADREWITSMNPKEYRIVSDDGLMLSGYLLSADTPTDQYVLCVHGYRMTGITEYDSIIRFYHDMGVNVFYIDQRACGNSEGEYITYGGLEQFDVLKWIDFMTNEFGKDIKISLHGISLGSATTMLVLGHELPENVKFAVCDCGYASVKSQLLHNFAQNKMPPTLSYSLYRLTSKYRIGVDPDKTSPVEAMENCHIPVIFAHGEADTFVPFEMVYAVYDACGSEDKKLITVPGAEHARAFFINNDIKNAIREYYKKYM